MTAAIALAIAVDQALDQGWVADGTLGAPDLSQAPRIALTEWHAMRKAASPGRLAWGCFESRIDGWAPEGEGLVLDKIGDVAASSAARAGLPAAMHVSATQRDHDVSTRDLVSDGDSPNVARVFLGFRRDGGDFAVACFALCAGDATCAQAVRASHLEGPLVPPPPPSLGLRALSFVVHHPQGSAMGLVIGACAAGAIAVSTRKRPRRAPR